MRKSQEVNLADQACHGVYLEDRNDTYGSIPQRRASFPTKANLNMSKTIMKAILAECHDRLRQPDSLISAMMITRTKTFHSLLLALADSKYPCIKESSDTRLPAKELLV